MSKALGTGAPVVVLMLALALPVLADAASSTETPQGATPTVAPDGTPISCLFALAVRGGDDPTGSSKFCTGYDFTIFKHPFNPDLSTLSVRNKTAGQTLTYLLSDIPQSKAAPELPGPAESPVLLLGEQDEPIPVVVIRRPQKIDIMLGGKPFKGPFQYRLRARTVEPPPKR